MTAYRSTALNSHLKPRGNRRIARLAFAASALALLAACETGPTPAEIHAMDWAQAARIDTPPAYATYMRVHPDGEYNYRAQARIDELRQLDAQSFAAAQAADTEDAYV